jgi:hypothetical protein
MAMHPSKLCRIESKQVVGHHELDLSMAHISNCDNNEIEWNQIETGGYMCGLQNECGC